VGELQFRPQMSCFARCWRDDAQGFARQSGRFCHVLRMPLYYRLANCAGPDRADAEAHQHAIYGRFVDLRNAGSGWFSVRAAARVGASGVVYAEDINSEAVDYIQARAQKEKLSNIKPVLGTTDDVKLPQGSIDAVLLLKVYHEIAHPVELMEKLRPSLRAGAKIGIIDRNGNGTDHGLNSDVVEREMGQAGFKLVGTYDFTKADGQDYFLIFVMK